MPHRHILLACLLGTFTLGGCGSMLSADKRKLSITSSPAGARITINGAPRGVTPATVEVDNRRAQNVVVRLDGHQPARAHLRPQLNPKYLVLDVFTPLFSGLFVDGAKGTWRELNARGIHVKFSE